jgi:hypothetical protein
VIAAFAGRWSGLAAAFVVPFAFSLAVSFATHEAPPVPRVNVRWSESVLPPQRQALEAAYRLVEPQFEGGRTWSYAILDSSSENLRRLVQNPSAEDTHGVERSAFRLSEPRSTPLSILFRLLGISSLIGLVAASLFGWIGRERSTSSTGSGMTGHSPPATRLPWPFHVLLIAAYPVLQLFGYNIEEVPLAHVVSPLFVTIGTGVIVWALAWPVFRSLSRSAIVASITVPPLLFFEPLHDFVTNLSPLLGRPSVFAGLSVVLCLGLLFSVRSVKSAAIEALTRAFNVFAVTIVLVALFPIVRFYAWDRAGSDASVEIPSRFEIESWSCQVGSCPDIYYLVLDGYGREDALRAAYGIQNEPFLSALRAGGFLVARRSTANYSNTMPSLRSALNMDYEHAPQDGTTSLRVDINLAVVLLRELGYDYILVPSGLPATSSSPLADVTLDVGTTQSELAALTLERSVLGAVIQSNRQKTSQLIDGGMVESLDGALQWHRHIEESFQAIGDIPVGGGPKFVFAHIVSPHPPYVFDRNGDLPPDSQMSDLSDLEAQNIWDSPKFAGQLSYLNRLVLELVERIQAVATSPPVIIIQGDHGSYRFGETGSQANPSDRLLAERMSILFAVLAPPGITEQFYDEITPVNVFRALFRGLFGAPVPFLDDRNYWSYVDPPREVSDVVQEPAFGEARATP